MKPLLEITPFLAVAVAAHVGVFTLAAQGGGIAGGDGGKGQITLEGGDPGVAAMIAAWERPPELAADLTPATRATSEFTTDAEAEALPHPLRSAAPVLPAFASMTAPADPPDTRPDPTPPAPPPASPPAPEPTPDLPGFAPSAGALPVPAPPTTPGLPGLFNRLERVSDLTNSSTALPDTAAPPPLLAAQPPVSSPRPLARPSPRPQQAARPQPPSGAAAPAQRAAGAGAQGHEGLSGQARQTSRAEVDTGGLLAQWGGAVRAAVQRQQRHPAGTRSGGTVMLRLDVHSDGHLLGVALQQSSGHAALDQAALDAVRRARLPAAPRGLNGSYQFSLPVRFRG